MAALITEIQSRGLQIPEEIISGNNRNLKWPIDDNGYFRRMDGKHYDPSEAQAGFVNSSSVLSLFKGGRGSGKTAAGAQKAIKKIMQGYSGFVYNPDFENLKTSTWPELREWIPWNLVIPRHQYRQDDGWEPLQPFKLVFKNKAYMRVKGVKEPGSARGPNINWLWYDEGGRDTEGLSWKIALASVRVGKNPQAWITTTPNYLAPWIDEFFIKRNIPEDALEVFEKLAEGRELVEYFSGSIYDNEKNLNPVFMATMLAAYPSGWLRRQEIYGESVRPDSALGDRHWFDGMYLSTRFETVNKRIRYWDLAATEKKMVRGREINDPDESVGTLMSYTDKKEFCIEHQQKDFVEWDGLLRMIRDTSIRDGIDVRIIVEEEPGSGGKNQVKAIDKYLKEQIPGHPGCEGWRPSQDRVVLANIWFGEANQKKIFIVKDGTWDVDAFLDQLDSFPGGKHDDMVTSVTGARINIAPIQKWKEIKFLHLLGGADQDEVDKIVQNVAPDGRSILLL